VLDGNLLFRVGGGERGLSDVSESFPLEARALAIAVFYAFGTAIGGALAPWIFALLIGTGERGTVYLGYLFGAALMVGAAIVELFDRGQGRAPAARSHCPAAVESAVTAPGKFGGVKFGARSLYRLAMQSPHRARKAGSESSPAGSIASPAISLSTRLGGARAIVTHGHGDHARPGATSTSLPPLGTIAIMQARYGENAGGTLQALRYGETATVNGVAVTLAPAGHVLGSAQVVLEYRGSRSSSRAITSAGETRLAPCSSPSNAMSSSPRRRSALPVFRHPPDQREIGRLLHSLCLFPERSTLSASMRWANASG